MHGRNGDFVTSCNGIWYRVPTKEIGMEMLNDDFVSETRLYYFCVNTSDMMYITNWKQNIFSEIPLKLQNIYHVT